MEGVLWSILAELVSLADSSTTTERIPNLFAEGCWDRRHLHNGIRYIPVASNPRISQSVVEGVLATMLAELYLIADSSTTAGRFWIQFAGGCWA